MKDSNEKLKVKEETYVNEATIELLRRRIETDVKRGFWLSVGAPVGGAGILAIVWMLLVWIPNNVGTMLRENQQVQDSIRQSAQDYLKKEKGEEFIRGQVEDSVKSLLPGVVRAAVDDALKDFEENTSQRIKDNMGRLVANVVNLDNVKNFDKGSVQILRDFLSSPQAESIHRNGDLLALSKVIRRGNTYEIYAIYEYIRELGGSFGEQFRYVLIQDEDRRFLALIEVEDFRKALNDDADKLVEFLNSPPEALSLEKARSNLKQWFGPAATMAIPTALSVGDALIKRSWKYLRNTDEIAVVDKEGQFVGVTSRNRLIDALLS